MGFTIDMVNGEILDETSTDISEDTISKNNALDSNSVDISEYGYTEQLVSIVEPDMSVTDISMPESIVNANVDSFLDTFS